MIGIYRITSPTGRVYIGQSRDIVSRWRCYKRLDCKTQQMLFRSLSKHGPGAHIFEVVQEYPNDIAQVDLNQMETVIINIFSEAGFSMLNIAGGGAAPMTDEVKRRISAGKKGRSMSTEGKRSWQEKRALFVMPEEGRRKISDAHKGKKFTEEHKQKLSEAAKRRYAKTN